MMQDSNDLTSEQTDPLETVPEKAPFIEGAKQKYQLNKAESILDKEKEISEEILETVPEKALECESAKQKYQLDQNGSILENEEEMMKDPLEIVPEDTPVNEGAKQNHQLYQADAAKGQLISKCHLVN